LKADAMLVSIVIPTKDRTLLLREALESVAHQAVPPWFDTEILVVDNSRDGSAAGCCATFGPRIRYIHEPRLGLSHARNRGISEAHGELVAFLDDDERAEPNWLVEICQTLRTTQADAAFGSVEPVFERQVELVNYARNIYRRRISQLSGTNISRLYYKLGTGNSCFVRSRCFEADEPFSTKFNISGGEDVYLLKNLVAKGRRLVWSPNARVLEWVPASRCCLDYLLLRRFRSGQIRCRILWRGSIRDLIRLILLMTAGLGQACIGMGRCLSAKVFSQRKNANEHLMTVAAGAGKLFWYLKTGQRTYT
jgi:glycosyltransferase involved in cell wall biosynthesis